MALRIVIESGSRAGAEHSLEGHEVFVIGSAPDAHLRLNDPGVQANHARIFKDHSRYLLMDTSGVGVTVNGRADLQAELKAGDVLRIGSVSLRVAPVAAAAELHVLKGPDEGKAFPIAGRVILGRGVNAEVPLLDMKCSREHCAVERRPDGFYLVDLGSTNGTRLNEVKLEPRGSQKLRTGDKVRLGGTLVEFHSLAVETRPAPPPEVVGERAAPKASPTPPPLPRPTERRPMPEAAAGAVFEIDLDAPSPGPFKVEPSQRDAATQRMGRPTGRIALEGELERMGFAEIVQLLNAQRKTGELRIQVAGREHGIAFHEGQVRDAWGISATTPEQCFIGIARLRHGRFEFHEGPAGREARIRQATMALLMDAMRMADEATDPGE